MADLDTSLSVGERLFFYRRRLKVSQAEMAKDYGVTRTVYGRWERDQLAFEGDPPSLGQLTRSEQAILLRRRAGKTQKELSGAIGLSRNWVSKMESGEVPCERLLEGFNGA